MVANLDGSATCHQPPAELTSTPEDEARGTAVHLTSAAGKLSVKTRRQADVDALAAFCAKPGVAVGPSEPAGSLQTHRAAKSWSMTTSASRVAMQDWERAELTAVVHMSELGLVGAHVTAPGADGGLDVVARDAAAQVKLHAKPTGSPDVQRLQGAAHGYEHRLFYANGYSPRAVQYANQVGVALFAFDAAEGVRPVSEAAIRLAHGAIGRAAAPVPPGGISQADLTIRSARARAQVAEVVKIAKSRRVPVGSKRQMRNVMARRGEAMTLANSATVALNKLTRPRMPFRQRMSLEAAERDVRKAAAKVGIRLT